MINTTEIVNNLYELTNRFKQNLNAEMFALETQNFPLLEKILVTKEQLTKNIESLQIEFYQALTSNNLPTTPEGVNILLNQSGDEDLKEKWKALSEKLIDCDKQNRINGTLSKNNTQFLNIISQVENQTNLDVNKQPLKNNQSTNEKRA